MFKYFSSLETPHEHPNLELLNSVHAYSDVRVEEVTSTLKCTYTSGDHEPAGVAQFRGVVQMLAKLHDRGYVHGDVRLQNIVFTKKDSVLIDFDLAKKEGETYPSGYNCEFEGTHPDTTLHGEMLKSHDIHSVLYLMD